MTSTHRLDKSQTSLELFISRAPCSIHRARRDHNERKNVILNTQMTALCSLTNMCNCSLKVRRYVKRTMNGSVGRVITRVT